MPDWLTTTVPPEPEPLPPIRPSSALGAADRMTRPGDGPYAPEARLRGTLVHALLERLPALSPEHRESMARAYVQAARAASAPGAARRSVLANALAVLDHPDLKPLFGKGSRAEAPIAGRVLTAEGAIMVSGQIDRLAVLEDGRAGGRFQDDRAAAEGRPAAAALLRGAARPVPDAARRDLSGKAHPHLPDLDLGPGDPRAAWNRT